MIMIPPRPVWGELTASPKPLDQWKCLPIGPVNIYKPPSTNVESKACLPTK